MYTFDPNAIGVQIGLNKRWQTVDLTTASVASLIDTFRIVQVTLTPQDASEPVYLLLHDLASQYQAYTGTFEQLLTAYFTSLALPTRTTPITRDRAIARYYDAFKQRFILELTDATNALASTVYDPADYDHIRLSRQDFEFDPATALANILVNINGFYHRTENIASRGLFVRDANKSSRLSEQNQAAVWDFTSLGGFTIVPVVPGQVQGSAFQANLTQDVSNKTVFFVIAGYFFQVDGVVVSQNGVNNFLINFAHSAMRLAARYFEAANYIDLSSIATIAADQNPGSIDTTKLANAEAVAAWMALTQTFAVIVNRKSCYMQSRYVQRSGNPNQYLCYLNRDSSPFTPNEQDDPRLSLTPPDLPLVLELGRHPPYWTTTERWVHSLTIYNNRIGQLLFESGQPAQGVITSGADQPGSPGLVQHAFLLEFGSDVQDS